MPILPTPIMELLNPFAPLFRKTTWEDYLGSAMSCAHHKETENGYTARC